MIDAQMPIRAKRIEYFNDPYFKAIHGAQAGELPFPEKEVSTSISGSNEKGRGDASSSAEAPGPSKKARAKGSPAPKPKHRKMPGAPVDQPAPKRESIQMDTSGNPSIWGCWRDSL